MNDVKVKICGLTRPEDAFEAARLGADAVGFNFWRGSQRYIRPARAWKIIRELPPFLTVVGVFVNASREEILRIARQCRLDLAQLHGDESPTFCARLGLPFVKAVRITGPYSLPPLRRFPGALLVDAPNARFGGGGEPFDWTLIQGITKERRIVLAGGLTAKNVAIAIETVRPYGVDVASGVESSPGIKDLRKMASFIRTAKGIA